MGRISSFAWILHCAMKISKCSFHPFHIYGLGESRSSNKLAQKSGLMMFASNICSTAFFSIVLNFSLYSCTCPLHQQPNLHATSAMTSLLRVRKFQQSKCAMKYLSYYGDWNIFLSIECLQFLIFRWGCCRSRRSNRVLQKGGFTLILQRLHWKWCCRTKKFQRRTSAN